MLQICYHRKLYAGIVRRVEGLKHLVTCVIRVPTGQQQVKNDSESNGTVVLVLRGNGQLAQEVCIGGYQPGAGAGENE